MRAACPSYIGRPGKQPAGSIQLEAESAPKVGYRGVGERLEAVEHGSYAPDGPLGARQHSSVTRLLEPFTTRLTRLSVGGPRRLIDISTSTDFRYLASRARLNLPAVHQPNQLP